MRSGPVNVGGRMVPPSEAGTQAAAEADRIEAARRGGSGGGGGGTCFPSDTPVLTPTGWRRIAGIDAGELVLTRSRSGRLFPQPVLKRKDHSAAGISTVIGDGGQELFRVTRSDTVLTDRGWIMVDRLRTGDQVLCMREDESESFAAVEQVVDTDAVEPVHNLIVAGTYNFVVRGCVSHSFTYFRWPRMALAELRRIAAPVFGHALRLTSDEQRKPSELASG